MFSKKTALKKVMCGLVSYAAVFSGVIGGGGGLHDAIINGCVGNYV